MIIVRVCPIRGCAVARDVDCTAEELALWEAGELIQHAMPTTSVWDREFVMSGLTEQTWRDQLGCELDDDEEPTPVLSDLSELGLPGWLL